jgi:hypothetical protein
MNSIEMKMGTVRVTGYRSAECEGKLNGVDCIIKCQNTHYDETFHIVDVLINGKSSIEVLKLMNINLDGLNSAINDEIKAAKEKELLRRDAERFEQNLKKYMTTIHHLLVPLIQKYDTSESQRAEEYAKSPTNSFRIYDANFNKYKYEYVCVYDKNDKGMYEVYTPYNYDMKKKTRKLEKLPELIDNLFKAITTDKAAQNKIELERVQHLNEMKELLGEDTQWYSEKYGRRYENRIGEHEIVSYGKNYNKKSTLKISNLTDEQVKKILEMIKES